jgi:tetratricopeptide (TPR) repeat protein
MIKHLKIILSLLFVVLALSGCKDDPQRNLQLAQWYSQKGLVDEAILEYREVTRLLPSDVKALSREEYEMLAKAHYSLALMYTKKDWWNYALREAETCFELLPTREHYDIVTLLRKRIDLQDTES